MVEIVVQLISLNIFLVHDSQIQLMELREYIIKHQIQLFLKVLE